MCNLYTDTLAENNSITTSCLNLPVFYSKTTVNNLHNYIKFFVVYLVNNANTDIRKNRFFICFTIDQQIPANTFW